MGKSISSPSFTEHLTSVGIARLQADQAVATLETNRVHADRAIAATWQFLFDHLCPKSKKKRRSRPELNDYTAIIHRLVQSMHKLGSMDKLSQARQREQIINLAKDAGLPLDLREDLERELNLIG